MRLKKPQIMVTYKLRSCAASSSCRRPPRSCTSTALSACLQLPKPKKLQNCWTSVYEGAFAREAVRHVPGDYQTNEDCQNCSTLNGLARAWRGFSTVKC